MSSPPAGRMARPGAGRQSPHEPRWLLSSLKESREVSPDAPWRLPRRTAPIERPVRRETRRCRATGRPACRFHRGPRPQPSGPSCEPRATEPEPMRAQRPQAFALVWQQGAPRSGLQRRPCLQSLAQQGPWPLRPWRRSSWQLPPRRYRPARPALFLSSAASQRRPSSNRPGAPCASCASCHTRWSEAPGFSGLSAPPETACARSIRSNALGSAVRSHIPRSARSLPDSALHRRARYHSARDLPASKCRLFR